MRGARKTERPMLDLLGWPTVGFGRCEVGRPGGFPFTRRRRKTERRYRLLE